MSEENYTEIKYLITTLRRQLGVTDETTSQLTKPYQPLLISLLNSVKKGCSTYYRFLRKKNNLNVTLARRETKWHIELGCNLNAKFWNQTYLWQANIKHENRIKWIQYQINRNILFTNYRVNKFSPNVSPFCSFCSVNNNNGEFETISHLFYSCNIIQIFWQSIRGWLGGMAKPIFIPFDKRAILFGIHDQNYDSPPNFIILCSKLYLWKTRLNNGMPCLNSFKVNLKNKLTEVKSTLFWAGLEREFNK